jgi:hypothetical protein
MSSLSSILEAIADQIRDVLDDSTDWTFQVEPGYVANPTPPTIDVFLGDPGRELLESGSFGATDADTAGGEWIIVRARVSPTDASAGQEILVELSDPESELSLVQALYDDPTLGGLASDISLENRSGMVPIPTIDGGAWHFGITWRFLVIPARS